MLFGGIPLYVHKNGNRRDPDGQNLYFGVLNHHAKADHMVCTWVRVILPRATFGERFFQAQLKSNQMGVIYPDLTLVTQGEAQLAIRARSHH